MFGLCLCGSFVWGWDLIESIKLNAKDIETDRMGNLYAISESNQLYKFDQNGKLIGTLNYAYLGNMSHIDASNPLELYVYYKELNSVVFLDNNLAFRGKLNFADVGISISSAMGRSNTNGIWVFDLGTMQLKRLNKDGSLVQESGNIRQFVQAENFNPTSIVDNGLRIYVCDSTSGILVFDLFANYLKTIPIKGLQELRLNQEVLFYRNQGKLIRYKLSTFERDTMDLPLDELDDFCIEQDRLYLLNNQGVKIYRYKN